MPFYHVLLSMESERATLRSVFVDLSEKELHKRFIEPYRKGKSIVSVNEVFPLSEIRKICIVRTARGNDSELADLQHRSFREVQEFNRKSGSAVFISAGYGYANEDIVEVGEDVTTEFIKGPPGHAASPNPIIAILGNAWVVSIGTGVLVAGIAWWFGWNG